MSDERNRLIINHLKENRTDVYFHAHNILKNDLMIAADLSGAFIELLEQSMAFNIKRISLDKKILSVFQSCFNSVIMLRSRSLFLKGKHLEKNTH